MCTSVSKLYCGCNVQQSWKRGQNGFVGESLMTDAKGQVIVKADDSDFAKNKMKPPLQI